MSALQLEARLADAFAREAANRPSLEALLAEADAVIARMSAGKCDARDFVRALEAIARHRARHGAASMEGRDA